MNVLVLRKDGLIEVTVTTEKQDDKGEREKWKTTDVEKYLIGQKIKYGTLVKGDVVTNTNPKKNKGTWLFKDFKKKTKTTEAPIVKDGGLALTIDKEILEDLVDKAKELVLDYNSDEKPVKKKTTRRKRTTKKKN